VRRLARAIAAAAVFLAALGHFAPGDLLLAALAGAAAAALSGRLPPAPRDWPRRAAWLPVLLAAVLNQVARGGARMMLVALGVRSSRTLGEVEVPIGERSDRGVAVTCLIAGLSPGTVFVELVPQRRAMLFHVIDASDPDGFRAEMDRFYRRYQRRVFP